MKTWKIGIMVAKKYFCQEGENLVNRRLLPFMLYLEVHFLLSHFHFPAHVSMEYILIETNSGATPYSVIEAFCDSHQLF